MAGQSLSHGGRSRAAAHDPLWLRVLLIAVAVGFIGVFLVLPLAAVFIEAFRDGVGAYLSRCPLAERVDHIPIASLPWQAAEFIV